MTAKPQFKAGIAAALGIAVIGAVLFLLLREPTPQEAAESGVFGGAGDPLLTSAEVPPGAAGADDSQAQSAPGKKTPASGPREEFKDLLRSAAALQKNLDYKGAAIVTERAAATPDPLVDTWLVHAQAAYLYSLAKDSSGIKSAVDMALSHRSNLAGKGRQMPPVVVSGARSLSQEASMLVLFGRAFADASHVEGMEFAYRQAVAKAGADPAVAIEAGQKMLDLGENNRAVMMLTSVDPSRASRIKVYSTLLAKAKARAAKDAASPPEATTYPENELQAKVSRQRAEFFRLFGI